jgi:electron transfer flavoprotein alpha subunit
MSVIVFVETQDNSVKKTSLEAVSMAAELAKKMGSNLTAVSDGGASDLSSVAKAGASTIIDLKVSNNSISQLLASALAEVSKELGAKVIIAPHSTLTEGMVSRLAVKLNATAVTNVMGLPDVSAGFVVRKSVFTSKAFVNINVNTEVKVLTLKKGSFDITENAGSPVVSSKTANATVLGGYSITNVTKQEGDILLPEADLVVSAGRGLKGPENWGMIEELAKTIGAATACSKPVSDVDWRPHHEHVGQTGIKISPNLYIAVGISGAIQHLAGVSSSKVIVVINTDPEAPFFKAADYGIVGDAFVVVPKLIEALKKG